MAPRRGAEPVPWTGRGSTDCVSTERLHREPTVPWLPGAQRGPMAAPGLLCCRSDLRHIIKSAHSFPLWPRWLWGPRPRLTGAGRGVEGPATVQGPTVMPLSVTPNTTHCGAACVYVYVLSSVGQSSRLHSTTSCTKDEKSRSERDGLTSANCRMGLIVDERRLFLHNNKPVQYEGLANQKYIVLFL